MPFSVESRTDAEPGRKRWAPPAGLANRPEHDWQRQTPRIRHQSAELRPVGRARVSTYQVGDR
jgi:hypothetical protein